MPNAALTSYGRQYIDEDDVAAVLGALRSDRLTEGPAVAAFERALAERVGAGDVVSCSNGTAALHLMMLALGIGPGDTVIVPAITFAATANAVRYAGGDVIFADVAEDTALMGGEQLATALSQAEASGRTVRAVFAVHMAGQAEHIPTLSALAARHGAVLLEDACHALGTAYAGPGTEWNVGDCSASAMAAFSFHPVKTVTTGEGGAVAVNDAQLATRLRRLRSHGINRDEAMFERADLSHDAGDSTVNPWYYEMIELGYNYRLCDIQAALGLSQMRKLDRFLTRRRELVARYDGLLAPHAPHILPPGRVPGCNPGWHLYMARIDFASLGMSRGQVMRELSRHGIGTQVHYIPVPWLPYWRRIVGEVSLPGAAGHYARCLSLPLHPGMEAADVDLVVETLVDILGLGS